MRQTPFSLLVLPSFLGAPENTEENAMTKCNQAELAFPSCKSRTVTADFAGGNISSIGGMMLLKQADPASPEQRLPAPGSLHPRRRPAGMKPEACCPRHRKNNGGSMAEPAQIRQILFVLSEKLMATGNLCALRAFV